MVVTKTIQPTLDEALEEYEVMQGEDQKEFDDMMAFYDMEYSDWDWYDMESFWDELN